LNISGWSAEMLGSSILVSLATLLVSFVGFANQLVLARLFGASMSMDAYLIAASVPMLVSGVLSAVLGYSLVPALMVHKSDFVAYRRFSGLLLISLIVVSVVISGMGFFAAPVQIEVLGETLSSAARHDSIAIARVSWMTAGVILVVGNLNAMHNAASRFLLPIFASMVPYIGMILAGLAFAPAYGPIAVAWGLFVGFILIIPMLLIHTLPTLDFSTRCLLLWKDVAGYLFRAPLIILAMLCFTAFQLIDSYWAPQIGIGNLSYLGYSQRLLIALGTLVIAGPSAVLLPRLAEAYADGRIKDLLHDNLRAVRMVIAFALPVALFVSILAVPLVRLLFERGAFDENATKGVASILPLMMTGMTAMLCVVMIFRALFAKHDIAQASMLGTLGTVLYFAFSGFLSQRLGVIGIALAYALSWWLVLFLSILILWRGYMKMIFCRENLVFAGQLVVLVVVTGILVAAGRHWIVGSEMGGVMLILRLGTVAALAVTVYFIVAIRVLGIEDVRLIYAFLSSKCALLKTHLEHKGI
jgi:putative peptidoglycan lipid II flippase